ncbi:outer membrane beta-barrel protein [Halioglobus maricola]|uniref:outer membrane beta-barrel protein n=1 Tax=Halioglobus maricola TaxID=2601894 RepID=UPI0014789E88|nr:outer membrane beta-barrel protein [Halioglobus maricola]
MKNNHQGRWKQPNGQLAGLALALACVQTAHAVDAQYFELGPVKVEPVVSVDAAWVDNVYRDAEDEQESWVIKTVPRIDARIENGPSQYAFRYELQDWYYTDSPEGEDDDFTGHLFRGDIDHRFNLKNRVELFGQHHKAHEERGTGLTEGGSLSRFTDTPVEYDEDRYGGTYFYGSGEGKGRLELGAEWQETDYTNYEIYTDGFDYEQVLYQGVFYWDVRPRTALVFDASYLDVTYLEERDRRASLDSDEIRLLMGVSWEASGKTRGEVKIGGYEREFEDPRRDKADGFAWDIKFNYRPKTYSSFDLTARQLSHETNGFGDYIETQEYTFNWLRLFRRNWQSKLGVLFANDDYSGIEREDQRLHIEWTLQKPVKRWLDLGVGWRFEDRESDDDNFTYNRQSLFVTMKASL